MTNRTYNPMDALWYFRWANQVTRNHCFGSTMGYSVGEHTLNMLQVYRVLTMGILPPNVHAYDYILAHDTAEVFTGDIPYPIKKHLLSSDRFGANLLEVLGGWEEGFAELMGFPKNEDHNSISPLEKLAISLSDILELAFFCTEAIEKGEFRLKPVLDTCTEVVKQRCEQIRNAQYQGGGTKLAVRAEDIMTALMHDNVAELHSNKYRKLRDDIIHGR